VILNQWLSGKMPIRFLVSFDTFCVDFSDLYPIIKEAWMSEKKLAGSEIIKTICELAARPANVKLTSRAEYDLLAEDLTKDDVCHSIIIWIGANKDVVEIVTNDVPAHLGEKAYVMKPTIAQKPFYVKVTILDYDTYREMLLIISSHP
jgi:hypothetical protein